MNPYWLTGIVMAAGLQAHPQDCNVNVYVMTGSGIPFGMPLTANAKATQMFREIGVNVRVRWGTPPRDPKGDCGAPIVIQIEAAGHYHGAADALAYALPYKDSGTCIHIFLDRLLRLGAGPGFANALLAHVMVHEITHVLEHMNRHSEEGIMKAKWSHHDYRQIEYRSLPFDHDDVDLILEGLARRRAHGASD